MATAPLESTCASGRTLPAPAGPAAVAARGGELSTSRRRVIVVDSDRRAASDRAAWLCGRGWHAAAAGSVDEARRRMVRGRVDCLVVAGGPAAAGAERFRAALSPRHAAIRLVALLAPGGGPEGWDGVVPLPADDGTLLAALEGAEPRPLPSAPVADAGGGRGVLGDSPAFRRVIDLVGRVADTGVTILLTGESGTGKSLLAREIHRASRRREGRFVEVACGSLSETLLESELFGHVAGAYTGAAGAREGRFAQADGGTIFLDEIATATPSLQVKLLRVLQEREFEPVGGGTTRKVDARIVLATHEDLGALVAAGRFRADLFWRINVVTIEMPALRERRGDIPLLAAHFLARAAGRAGRAVEGFSAAALEALVAHDWPGNVRELEHAVERGVFLGTGPTVDVGDLPPAIVAARPAAARGPLRSALAVPERQLILEALERHGWRRDAAARALGINRTTLYKKARRLGIDMAAVPSGR